MFFWQARNFDADGPRALLETEPELVLRGFLPAARTDRQGPAFAANPVGALCGRTAESAFFHTLSGLRLTRAPGSPAPTEAAATQPRVSGVQRSSAVRIARSRARHSATKAGYVCQ